MDDEDLRRHFRAQRMADARSCPSVAELLPDRQRPPAGDWRSRRGLRVGFAVGLSAAVVIMAIRLSDSPPGSADDLEQIRALCAELSTLDATSDLTLNRSVASDRWSLSP